MTQNKRGTELLHSSRGEFCRRLLNRRIVTPEQITGEPVGITRAFLRDYSCRRQVYQGIGEYFPEPEAREILLEAQRHAWLEAERAGRDIWKERDPSAPHLEALRDWFRRHFRAWAEAHGRRTAPRAA